MRLNPKARSGRRIASRVGLVVVVGGFRLPVLAGSAIGRLVGPDRLLADLREVVFPTPFGLGISPWRDLSRAIFSAQVSLVRDMEATFPVKKKQGVDLRAEEGREVGIRKFRWAGAVGIIEFHSSNFQARPGVPTHPHKLPSLHSPAEAPPLNCCCFS